MEVIAVKFESLLSAIGDQTVFQAKAVAGGDPLFQKQLVGWTRRGKLVQLRRGVYAIASPYRPTPAPETVANEMFRPSYVSLESALAHYGLIPEWVPTTVSVTTGRHHDRVVTNLGEFVAHQIKPELFWGFKEIVVAPGQKALIADPEKALLDLIYQTPGGDTVGFLKELRLQNLEDFNLENFHDMAKRSGSPKLMRAAKRLVPIVEDERSGWDPI